MCEGYRMNDAASSHFHARPCVTLLFPLSIGLEFTWDYSLILCTGDVVMAALACVLLHLLFCRLCSTFGWYKISVD